MITVKLTLASDQDGVRAVLGRMLENLLASHWIERSFVTSESPTEKMFKEVARIVTKKRACMDALGVERITQVLQYSKFDLSSFENGVYCLSLSTDISVSDINFFDRVISPDFDYACGESLREDGHLLSSPYYYLIEKGKRYQDLKLKTADKEYGENAVAAAFSRVFFEQELPLNEHRLKKLAAKDDGEGIRLHAGEAKLREVSNDFNLASLFKKGNYKAYEAILEISSSEYKPRGFATYMETMCEKGLDSALSVFIKRFAWSKPAAAKAIGLLAAYPGYEWACEQIKERAEGQ